MRYTLLDAVQLVLSSINGEPVNSIFDTQEAQQIADLAQRVYLSMRSYVDLKAFDTLFEFVAPSSSGTPTLLTIPDDVERIYWVKFDILADPASHDFVKLQEVDLEDLLNMDATGYYNIVVNGDTIEIPYRDDGHPTKFAIMNDNVLFDSYLASEYGSIPNDRTLAFGRRIPYFEKRDDWVVPFDDAATTMFIESLISKVWEESFQQQNRGSAGTIGLMDSVMKARRTKGEADPLSEFYKLPDFSRKPRKW